MGDSRNALQYNFQPPGCRAQDVLTVICIPASAVYGGADGEVTGFKYGISIGNLSDAFTL